MCVHCDFRPWLTNTELTEHRNRRQDDDWKRRLKRLIQRVAWSSKGFSKAILRHTGEIVTTFPSIPLVTTIICVKGVPARLVRMAIYVNYDLTIGFPR